MTSTWNKVLILCISFLFLSSCGGSDEEQEQTNQTAIRTPSNAIVLSTDGVGKINASTPFNIHLITQIFNGLNVSQQTNFQEGEAYPVMRVAKGAKTLMTINPTTDHKSIYSIVIEDNLIISDGISYEILPKKHLSSIEINKNYDYYFDYKQIVKINSEFI